MIFEIVAFGGIFGFWPFAVYKTELKGSMQTKLISPVIKIALKAYSKFFSYLNLEKNKMLLSAMGTKKKAIFSMNIVSWRNRFTKKAELLIFAPFVSTVGVGTF